VLDAVWVTLGGMAIVFGALLLVMLAMMGLGRWFKPEEGETEEKKE